MVGKLIADRYRIMELIGNGGMANVYKAYDEQEWRIVALKVLKEEHSQDAEFLRHFQNEAQAVLTLSHPNIVHSFDVGADKGINFIVLEYVQGKTLKELIQEHGPFSPKAAVQIVSQVLGALAHAHEYGIIHRDVKPQNVIVTPSGRAKLTDFGIARDAAATTRTFAGTNVIGSVHYFSPEQARGEEVTAESDIYSCAIMLYEMLLGSVPFAGDNTVAIALKHLRVELTPPNAINPRIPRSLSDVVVKAASKKPEMRYGTATEMRTDLHRALREPHGSFARIGNVRQPVDQSKKKDKKAKRNNYRRIANIGLLIFLATGLFAALFFSVRAFRDAREEASGFVVPTLLNKKLSEATELAKLRGFSLEVQGYKASDTCPAGSIISQTPGSGTRGKEGDIIIVVVSTGSDTAVVPPLTNMPLQDALDALGNVDLKASINYMTSDRPEGTVIRQDPAAETELFFGDTVSIWVSGQEDNTITMPSVTGKSFEEAVELIQGNGFTRIFVRFDTPTDGTTVAEETVYKQSPASAMNVSIGTSAEIWVNRSYRGEYSADIARNLDNAESEKSVMVTAKLSDSLEIVLYQGILPVGLQQPISFTAYLRVEGEYICTFYVDGVEVKSMKVQFSKRGNGNTNAGAGL